MTNLILSINHLDYAVISTGYDNRFIDLEDRFIDFENDDAGKPIMPINELISELNNEVRDITYIGTYSMNGDTRVPIHGNIPAPIMAIINSLPISGIIFEISNVSDVFHMGNLLSDIANKYELMYGCDLLDTYQMRYIDNNGVKILSLEFDTESG